MWLTILYNCFPLLNNKEQGKQFFFKIYKKFMNTYCIFKKYVIE